jgi:uncharacterized protein (TIGR02118 family)
MDYYFNKHIPMVRKKLGTACKCVDAEQGLSGIPIGTPATYIAMCHLYFESMEAFQTAFGLYALGNHGRYAQLHHHSTHDSGQ